MIEESGAITRQQIERILISGVLIIAIFFGITRLRKAETRKEASKEDLAAGADKIKVLEAERLPTVQKVEYMAGTLRDPFTGPLDGRPKEEFLEKIELPAMKIQGMVIGGRLSQAIIDNKVYKVGESVNEAEIIDITTEGVHLRYKGREFVVRPK